MEYFLIDNCCLDEIINEDQILLETIKALTEREQALLLLPERLKSEWEESKEKLLGKKIKRSSKKTDIGRFSSNESVKAHRIKKMDFILENFSVEISPNDKDLRAIYDLQSKGKAPFHDRNNKPEKVKNKKDHSNDAYIIYTSLNWCKREGISTLIFCSNNYTEYSQNTSKKHVLHPDYSSFHRDINIDYFRTVRSCLHSRFGDVIKSVIQEKDDTAASLKFPLVESPRSINEMRDAINEYFKHYDYLPGRIIAGSIPFMRSNSSNTYYEGRSRTIGTTNKLLYDCVKKCAENQSKSEKNRTLIYNLSKCLINWVRLDSKSNEFVKVDPLHDESCRCIRCSYWRLDLKTMKRAMTNPRKFEDIQKASYVSFELRMYDKAKKYTSRIINSRQKKTEVKVFLAMSNIQKIPWNRNDFELKKNMNVESCWVEIRKMGCTPIVDNVFRNLFQLSALDDCLRSSKDIDRYINSKKKGDTDFLLSNHYSWFLQYDQFLHLNYLFVESSPEYKSIVYSFLSKELDLYCYCSKDEENRFELTNYFFRKALFHTDNMELRELFESRNINSLNIKTQIGKSGFDIISTIMNLLSTFGVYSEEANNNMFLQTRLSNLVSNALSIVRYGNLSKKELSQVVNLSGDILKLEKSYLSDVPQVLSFLIDEKGGDIDIKSLTKLTKACVVHKTIQRKSRLLDSISKTFRRSKKTIELNKEERVLLMQNMFFEGALYTNSYLGLVGILEEGDFKLQCQNEILNYVGRNKDISLLFRALINESLELDVITIEVANEIIHEKLRASEMTTKDHKAVVLYVELIRRYEFEENNVIPEIHKRNKFYEWLVAPNDFDYRYFDLVWLSHVINHKTLRNIMAKCVKLEEWINKKADKNSDYYYLTSYLYN